MSTGMIVLAITYCNHHGSGAHSALESFQNNYFLTANLFSLKNTTYTKPLQRAGKQMSIEAQKKFIESLTNGGMIDSIFGYAYKRCFSEYEAEDLCHEIIIEVLLALQKNHGEIINLNAYIWQIY